ncbi:hypothetical protein VPH35_053921 [Triticum aestivum]|uniref:Uncharacterized protein n=1 Tax=Triticum aestivum TaxID=4565 RepID=A0A077S5C5_WHEAT|nr:unnamed protein product [Triticum aestivum]
MAAKKPDEGCGHGVHGITPTKILTDALPELTILVECGAGHSFTTIDVNNIAAPTPTRCCTKCPSRNATINIFPELASPAVRHEALDIKTVHVTAPTPAICSTRDLDHGNIDEKLMTFPVMRLFSTLEVGPPTFSAVLVSTNANEVTAHQFMPDMAPGWKPQGKVVRPAPWPSFLDEGTSADCGDIIEPPPSVATVPTNEVAPYVIWREIMLVDNDHNKEYQVDLVFGPQPEFKTIIPQPLGQPGEISNWNIVANHAGTKPDEQCDFICLPAEDSLFTNREVPDASRPIRVQSHGYPHSYSEVGQRISTSCTHAALSVLTRAYNPRMISESMRANNRAHNVKQWLLLMGNIRICVRVPHMFENVNKFFDAGETRVTLRSLTLDVLQIASYLGTVGTGACL